MGRKQDKPVDDDWSEKAINDPYATTNDDSFGNDNFSNDSDSFTDEVVIEETTEEDYGSDSFGSMNSDNNNKQARLRAFEEQIIKQMPVGKDGKPLPIPKLSKPAECMILATGGVMQGAIAGIIFGAFNTAITGVMQGHHRMPGFGRYVGAGSRQTAAQFSMWLGTFYGARCAVKPFIHNDMASSAVGGFAAGFVSGLKTRNFRAMVAQGMISGGLVTLFDMFSTKPM